MNIKKLKALKNNRKGFTLIEIIVVIVILAVLMAVAVPSVLNYINEADDAKLMANARAVMTTAQVEVVKQDTSADGLTADELDILLGTTDKGIASIVGVDDVVVTTLYTGKVAVDEKTLAVSGGSIINKEYLEKAGQNKPELTAVEMTIGTDATKVVAVINDKIYVAK